MKFIDFLNPPYSQLYFKRDIHLQSFVSGVAPKENRSDVSTGLSGVKSSVHDKSSKIGDSLYEQDFEEAGYDTSSSTIKTDALEDDHDSVPSQKVGTLISEKYYLELLTVLESCCVDGHLGCNSRSLLFGKL